MKHDFEEKNEIVNMRITAATLSQCVYYVDNRKSVIIYWTHAPPKTNFFSFLLFIEFGGLNKVTVTYNFTFLSNARTHAV